jgi:hypothetical protein
MSCRKPSGNPAPAGFRASENLASRLFVARRLRRRNPGDRVGAFQIWLSWAVEMRRNVVASNARAVPTSVRTPGLAGLLRRQSLQIQRGPTGNHRITVLGLIPSSGRKESAARSRERTSLPSRISFHRCEAVRCFRRPDAYCAVHTCHARVEYVRRISFGPDNSSGLRSTRSGQT